MRTRRTVIPTPDGQGLIGSLGYITVRIGGGTRAGEVQLAFQGGSECFIAYADDPIDRGEQVVVVDRRPGRAVVVTRFDD